MRKLKFRCWDKKESKWLFGYEYPNLGGFTLFGEVVLMGELNSISLDRLNDIETMQYIGLQDVNGKDIYEGDILQWTSKFKDTDITTPNKRGQVKYNLQGCVYHINYEMQGKHYFKELSATFGGDVYVMETVEIVGNVFETPELLNF